MKSFFDSVTDLEFDLLRIGEVCDRGGLFEEWDSLVNKLIRSHHLHQLGTVVRSEDGLDFNTLGLWHRPDFSSVPCTFKEFIGKGMSVEEYAYSMRLEEALDKNKFKENLTLYFKSPMAYEKKWAKHLELLTKNDNKEHLIADLRSPEDVEFKCYMDYRTNKLVVKLSVRHKLWTGMRSKFRRRRKIIL